MSLRSTDWSGEIRTSIRTPRAGWPIMDIALPRLEHAARGAWSDGYKEGIADAAQAKARHDAELEEAYDEGWNDRDREGE